MPRSPERFFRGKYLNNAGADAGSFSVAPTGDTAPITVTGGVVATLGLSPKTATNPAGVQHCVTATVEDVGGAPTPNVRVVFSVSGANNSGGSQMTDSAGQAQFCYTGTNAGGDTITAFADTNGNGVQDTAEPSDTAGKNYATGAPVSLSLTPPTGTNTVDQQHCVTATVTDQFGNRRSGTSLTFSVSGIVSANGTQTTNTDGRAQFCFTSALPGSASVSTFADTNVNGTQDTGEPSATVTKTFVVPPSTPGCKVTGGGQIITASSDKANFGGNARVLASGLQGEEQYTDHGPATPVDVHSLTVAAVSCTGTQASIFGTATINGSGSFAFRIDMKDAGEPGTSDTYRIRLSNSYDSGNQAVRNGNIQVHY